MTRQTLCSSPDGCCPMVERKGDVVTIVDDDGGKATITYEQYLLLKQGSL